MNADPPTHERLRRTPTSGRSMLAVIAAVVAAATFAVPVARATIGPRLHHQVTAELPTPTPTALERYGPPTVARRPDEPGLHLRTVPAVAEFQVLVDGIVRSTDQHGRIDLPDAGGNVDLVALTVIADPAILKTAFGQWSDGTTDAHLHLAANGAPEPDLFLNVSYRVTVGPDRPGSAAVTFRSDSGDVTVTPGRQTWVPASRVVDTPIGPRLRAIAYRHGTQRFRATPEAIWEIAPHT